MKRQRGLLLGEKGRGKKWEEKWIMTNPKVRAREQLTKKKTAHWTNKTGILVHRH